MRKTVLIVKREYRTQVRQKSFKIMTFLAPLAVVGLSIAVTLINHFDNRKKNIAVIDPCRYFSAELKGETNFTFSFFDASEKAQLKKRLQEQIDALLVIPEVKDLDQLEKSIIFYSYKSPSTKLLNELKQFFSREITNLKLKKNGIDGNLLAASQSNVQLKTVSLENQAQKTQQNSSRSLLIGGMMYVLMMFIIIYGVRVMRGVLEEKNNRIVEVMISSVAPFELMMGKILGTALVALTQFTLWMVLLLIAVLFFQLCPISSISQMSGPLGELHAFFQSLKTTDFPFLLSMFCVYFTGGYLLFSAFFAAIGAVIENESDTQQYSIVGSVILIAGFYGGISALDNPDSLMVFWLSMIPFTSPITMLGRLYTGVGLWQTAASLMILGISIGAMVVFSAKIYRLGILRYGEKLSLGNLLSWLRAKN